MNSKSSSSGIWLEKLELNGFRITAPRRAVVEVLAVSNTIMDPLEIFLQAKKTCKSLGLVTVYRTLDKLEQLELIQRVHDLNGCRSFISAGEGHQHMLMCAKCNRTVFFSASNLSDWINKAGKTNGFQVNDHWLQIFGICPECRKKEKTK